MPTSSRSARPIAARPLAPGQLETRRTRVANGRALLAPEGNGNGWWARRYGEILSLRLDDLGGGDVLSEGQVSLSKRAATIEVELEAMDAKLSNGGEVDLDLYSRMTGTLARVLEKLGLQRRKRDVTPDLASYIAAHAEREAAP